MNEIFKDKPVFAKKDVVDTLKKLDVSRDKLLTLNDMVEGNKISVHPDWHKYLKRINCDHN